MNDRSGESWCGAVEVQETASAFRVLSAQDLYRTCSWPLGPALPPNARSQVCTRSEWQLSRPRCRKILRRSQAPMNCAAAQSRSNGSPDWAHPVDRGPPRNDRSGSTISVIAAFLGRLLQEPSLPVLRGGARPLRPKVQTSTFSEISRASSTSTPRYLTVLSIFAWPSNS